VLKNPHPSLDESCGIEEKLAPYIQNIV
jgi:hypothetical protein